VHTDRLTVGQPVPTATAEARQSMNALNPGDRVTHATFGEGEILSIKPMGADKLIEVMFDTAGTKKLMGTYAKLKKED
jgi:DNA helicase-2/ATP-dependent DNA helicase PcrA